MKIKTEYNEVDILRHALCETKLGIAGYIEVMLEDGRHVSIVGRWDDPYKAVDECSHIAEHIIVNGEYVESTDENSFNLLLSESDFFSAEDLAYKIWEKKLTEESFI